MLKTGSKISKLTNLLFCAMVLLLGACSSSRNATSDNDQAFQSNDSQVSASEVEKPVLSETQILRDSLRTELRGEIFRKYQSRANQITTFYILAQQNFYNNNFEEALYLINRAANIKETADILALRGSIYYGLGSMEGFLTNWRRALDMDSNLPIPPSPPIIAALKEEGLINDNLERNY